MAMDTSGLPFKKGQPAVLTRGWKKAAKETALAKAYRIVDERDGSICRVTGVRLSPFAQLASARREHHHLRGRIGDYLSDPTYIVTLSALCHDLATKNILLPLTDDATQPIRWVWNRRIVAPGREPFRLRPSVNGERAA